MKLLAHTIPNAFSGDLIRIDRFVAFYQSVEWTESYEEWVVEQDGSHNQIWTIPQWVGKNGLRKYNMQPYGLLIASISNHPGAGRWLYVVSPELMGWCKPHFDDVTTLSKGTVET